MPIQELEYHPFLNHQINSKAFKIELVSVAIIGTFPIYEITDSIAISDEGKIKKTNWEDKSYFKYFYGSKKNHFWKIISEIYKKNFPKNVEECIDLLNENNVFISDTIKSCERLKFDYQDSSLKKISLNYDIKKIINLMASKSLSRVCFTSDEAKSLFCQIMDIPNRGRIESVKISNKNIELRTLPTPASNGRTVRFFFKNYPLSHNEVKIKEKKLPFAIDYRKRVYADSLLLNI